MGNVTFSSPCSSNEGILIHDPSDFLLLHLIAESRWTCFSRCDVPCGTIRLSNPATDFQLKNSKTNPMKR